MRILIIFSGGDFPFQGAASRFVHLIAKGFQKLGHDIHIIVPRAMRPGASKQTIDGCSVEWCWVPNDSNGDYINGRSRRMVRWLRSRTLSIVKTCSRIHHSRYNWVLYYAPSIAELPSALLASLQKTSVMAIFGDMRWIPHAAPIEDRILQNIGRWIDMTFARLSSAILIAGSSLLEDYFRRKAPKARFVRVPPPVDVDSFAKGQRHRFRTELHIGDDELVVYSGSLQPFEGVHDLVKAVSELVSKHPNIKLLIASHIVNQELRTNLYSTIVGCGLQERAFVLESLQPNDVVDLLAAGDVLVIPKRNHAANHAAMPIKLSEYLGAGRPIVAASIGDIPRFLRHGENSLLFEPGDIAQMREQISSLLINKELAARLSQSARELAKREFDIQSIISTILHVM